MRNFSIVKLGVVTINLPQQFDLEGEPRTTLDCPFPALLLLPRPARQRLASRRRLMSYGPTRRDGCDGPDGTRCVDHFKWLPEYSDETVISHASRACRAAPWPGQSHGDPYEIFIEIIKLIGVRAPRGWARANRTTRCCCCFGKRAAPSRRGWSAPGTTNSAANFEIYLAITGVSSPLCLTGFLLGAPHNKLTAGSAGGAYSSPLASSN